MADRERVQCGKASIQGEWREIYKMGSEFGGVDESGNPMGYVQTRQCSWQYY